MPSDSEATLQRLIQLDFTKRDARLFRNNVGTGWCGSAHHISKHATIYVSPGDVVIRHARPLHAGLCKGSHDLIGWIPLTITQAMVNKIIAVFASVEVKSIRGKPTEEQLNFKRVVDNAGGFSSIAHSVEQAAGDLHGFIRFDRL